MVTRIMANNVAKRILVLLLCLTAIVIVTQETASAYNFNPPYNINKQLWALTRYELYPNTVNTSGQTTRIRGVWLGKGTMGSGTDWVFISKDPANGANINVSSYSSSL